jgi:hypothetical protein
VCQSTSGGSTTPLLLPCLLPSLLLLLLSACGEEPREPASHRGRQAVICLTRGERQRTEPSREPADRPTGGSDRGSVFLSVPCAAVSAAPVWRPRLAAVLSSVSERTERPAGLLTAWQEQKAKARLRRGFGTECAWRDRNAKSRLTCRSAVCRRLDALSRISPSNFHPRERDHCGETR